MWDKKWVIGNWKMNGQTANNAALIQQLTQLPHQNQVNIGIAPPSVYLWQAQQILHTSSKNNPIQVFAQDCSRFNGKGAYTGEVSADMLKDIGVEWTLVGHSERHLYFNEHNDICRSKLENALSSGLTPLLCVGESLQDREVGQEKSVVAHQLSILKNLASKHIAVAYEPVWAIGTGKVANTEQIADMHAFIYQEILSLCGEDVKIRVLYGGSVNANNAAEVFSVPYVDGALVGGASLQYESFTAIIAAAQQAK